MRRWPTTCLKIGWVMNFLLRMKSPKANFNDLHLYILNSIARIVEIVWNWTPFHRRIPYKRCASQLHRLIKLTIWLLQRVKENHRESNDSCAESKYLFISSRRWYVYSSSHSISHANLIEHKSMRLEPNMKKLSLVFHILNETSEFSTWWMKWKIQ